MLIPFFLILIPFFLILIPFFFSSFQGRSFSAPFFFSCFLLCFSSFLFLHLFPIFSPIPFVFVFHFPQFANLLHFFLHLHSFCICFALLFFENVLEVATNSDITLCTCCCHKFGTPALDARFSKTSRGKSQRSVSSWAKPSSRV